MIRYSILVGFFVLVLPGVAFASKLGVSISHSSSNLAILVKGIEQEALKQSAPLQIEFAEGDVNRQLSQVQNFIASRVDAIIVNAVETSATPTLTKMAADAKIPLVYVNNTPSDVNELGENAAFVGSDEYVAGKLQAEEVCRILKQRGHASEAGVVIVQGMLANETATLRSAAVHDVAATDECRFMKILDEQPANWDPVRAQDLVTNWIVAGFEPVAVISNNDEMAIGAINGLNSIGMDLGEIIVAGVDATRDAMNYMQRGLLTVTVFQDSLKQGAGAVDTAIKMAKGEPTTSPLWIPYEVVNAGNLPDYLNRN